MSFVISFLACYATDKFAMSKGNVFHWYSMKSYMYFPWDPGCPKIYSRLEIYTNLTENLHELCTKWSPQKWYPADALCSQWLLFRVWLFWITCGMQLYLRYVSINEYTCKRHTVGLLWKEMHTADGIVRTEFLRRNEIDIENGKQSFGFVYIDRTAGGTDSCVPNRLVHSPISCDAARVFLLFLVLEALMQHCTAVMLFGQFLCRFLHGSVAIAIL